MLNLLTSFFMATCDAPEPWLLGFQDGASPTFEGITELHDTIFFYLIVIGVAVGWVLASIVSTFSENRSPISHRYANHGTLIEVVWTVTPALVLVAIAFPSFKLLYLMDEVISPSMTVKVVGHQWYNFEFESDFCLNDVNVEYEALIGITATLLRARSDNSYQLAGSETQSLALVPYGGTNSSTVGMGKLPFVIANMIALDLATLHRMIGHMLGDGTIRLTASSIGANAYFSITQGLVHLPYLLSMFSYLSCLCNRVPRATTQGAFTIETRALPVLTQLWALFYLPGVSGKLIKDELFPYLASPAVLATWFMDDGSNHYSGFYLHIQGFGWEAAYKLAGWLHYHHGLFVSVHSQRGLPVLYVNSLSRQAFIDLVQPHMHPSMCYKLETMPRPGRMPVSTPRSHKTAVKLFMRRLRQDTLHVTKVLWSDQMNNQCH
jgi:heme/copper-type cytochrome/quinol oxidase subunit 2